MKIIQMSVFDKWPLENESVQAIICSPPYYQKRVYDIPNCVIGGNKECDHILNESNFCTKCNAWIGQYGRETNFGSEIEIETIEYELCYNLFPEETIYIISELIKRGIIA